MPDRRPTPVTSLRKLRARIRARGTGEILSLVEDRIKENLSSEETLIFFSRRTDRVVRDTPGLRFREATAPDGARYERDIGTDSAKTFTDRLGSDVRCFVVEDADRLLHATWVTTAAAWTREIRGYLAPPVGDAYIYESFTRDDARGRGVYPFALAGIVTTLSADGVPHAWVAAESTNLASRRAIAKIGFEAAFELTYSRRFAIFRLREPIGDHAAIGGTFVRMRKRGLRDRQSHQFKP